MNNKFNYLDPKMIMAAVITLIVFVVAIYAYFTTMGSIPVDSSATDVIGRRAYLNTLNASNTGNTVLDIMGIVILIGAILLIVGVVYSYLRPRY